MKWTPGGSDEDVEDRRDSGGGGGGFGGGNIGGVHIGIGGLIVLGVLSFVFKTDLLTPFIGGSGPQSVATSTPDPARTQAEQPIKEFVTFVLDDVQAQWQQILPPLGKQYRHAKLVLFRDATDSGCGTAQSATGPFYCPDDEKVYIDLGFYQELRDRFGAPGQFAQAYVLAHELGHHVQKILGIEQKVTQLQQQNPSQQNPLSVRLELQADCFAGVWGNTTQQRNLLEAGDIESGLQAAAAVGDDRIASAVGARIRPESFTHGSAADRSMWFKRGFQSGRVQDCDTFAGQ
jgi:predicted metalloprotease